MIVGKVVRTASQEPALTVAQLSTIELPVLVMSGDDDGVALSHTVELYHALPQGQLAVLPGTSHAVFMEKPGLVNEMILAFLGEEAPPVTILPIRRRQAAAS